MDKKTCENVHLRKRVGHNRGSLEQSYYWGSGWLMDYFLEKVFGCNVSMGFNGVLTRHPIFWERIHFEKSKSPNLHRH